MLLNCLSCAIIFGITPIMEKHVLTFIHIETYILLGALILFLLSIIYYTFLYNHNLLDELSILNKNRNVLLLFVLSITLIYFVANYLFLHTLSNNKAHLVTALIATYPIITMIIAYLFLNEEITFYHSFGVFLIVGGVILLNI